MKQDILITGGTIIDGTGQQAFAADLAVSNGRIYEIGQLENVPARRTIDARGLTVSPGFIDIHGHSDISLLVCPTADSKVMQGVTTEIGGNCGESGGPVSDKTMDDFKDEAEKYGIQMDWRRLGELLERLEGRISINYGTLVGLGTVRGAVMGSVDRAPTRTELSLMKSAVREALEDGALGISTGLVYPPGMYAHRDEIAQITASASESAAIYATHMRGEGDTIETSITEAIDVSRRAGVPLQISHLKTVGKKNWGKMKDLLSKLEDAREDGVDVMADRYPYTASATSLVSMLPSWAHEGGRKRLLARLESVKDRMRLREAVDKRIGDIGWDKIVFTNTWTTDSSDLEGKSIAASAAERELEPFELLVDVTLKSRGLASIVAFSQDESDMLTTLVHPLVMVGSDSGVKSPEGKLGEGKPHPRSYGAFPAFYRIFVREKKLLSPEQAIRKMTGMTAERLRLNGRGLLKKSCWADVVVFDEEIIRETSTYEDPHSFPEGIEYVLVNGRLVVDRGRHTKSPCGKVLRSGE